MITTRPVGRWRSQWSSPAWPSKLPALGSRAVLIVIPWYKCAFLVSAHKFHERHNEIFHVEEEKNFIRALRKLDSRTEVLAAKDISDFRLVVVCAAIFLCGFGRRNLMQSHSHDWKTEELSIYVKLWYCCCFSFVNVVLKEVVSEQDGLPFPCPYEIYDDHGKVFFISQK